MSKGLAITCLGSLFLLGSCLIVVEGPRGEGGRWLPGASFEKTFPMKPGEEVSLENGRGDIEVVGWDEEKLQVRAEERRETLPSGRVRFHSWTRGELDIEVQSSAGRISIRTPTRVQEDEGRSVDYDLRVPRSVHLRPLLYRRGHIQIADIYGSVAVEGEEGDVIIENFSGSLDIRLGQGDVEAEVLDIRPEDEIHIATEKGHIRLYLEPQARIQLEASAPNGSIVSDFDLNPQLEPGTSARVSLHALSGDIWIKKGKE